LASLATLALIGCADQDSSSSTQPTTSPSGGSSFFDALLHGNGSTTKPGLSSVDPNTTGDIRGSVIVDKRASKEVEVNLWTAVLPAGIDPKTADETQLVPQRLVATTTSEAKNGNFNFKNIPGGYYILTGPVNELARGHCTVKVTPGILHMVLMLN